MKTKMMKIKVSQQNIAAMNARAEKFKVDKNTIYNYGHKYGFLCEQIFLDNFGGQLIDNNNYDILMPNGAKIDIKTKKCRMEPLPHYNCGVYEYQINKSECNTYVFFRCQEDMSYVWILGAISKEDFLKQATLTLKGERDGRFVAPRNTYNILISELKNVVDFML